MTTFVRAKFYLNLFDHFSYFLQVDFIPFEYSPLILQCQHARPTALMAGKDAFFLISALYNIKMFNVVT